MSWYLRGIRNNIPLLLTEKDRGSRPGEIRNITLLLIELLEMWLRSMTVYFYGGLFFLGKFTHQSQEYWPTVASPEGTEPLQLTLLLAIRILGFSVFAGKRTPKGKHRATHAPVSHSKCTNYTSHFPPLSPQGREGTRKITVFELPPHRIKHQRWGISVSS